MIIDLFEWDEANVDHIARHHIDPAEAEEMFDSKTYIFKTHSGRCITLGQTAAGRYLMCVFEGGRSPQSIRIITARDMNRKERKLFMRKVK